MKLVLPDTKTRQTFQKENYGPKSLMNIDQKKSLTKY